MRFSVATNYAGQAVFQASVEDTRVAAIGYSVYRPHVQIFLLTYSTTHYWYATTIKTRQNST